MRRAALPPLALAVGYWAAVVSPAMLLVAGPANLPFAPALSIFLALAAVMMIVMQFVSSGRFELLAGRTGLDVMMGFHRFAAKALVAAVTAHVAVELWLSAGEQFAQLPTSVMGLVAQKWLWSGTTATAILMLVVFTAIHRDRLGLKYELWRASHGLAAITLLALTTHHAWTNGTLIHTPVVKVTIVAALALAVAAVLVIYAYRGWKALRGGWVVTGVQTLAPKLHEVTLEMRQGTRFSFEAGQFVWATFGRRHPINDHPFSISSAPEELPLLRLLIKENGDFTNHIGKLPRGTQAFLDGPHGNLVVKGCSDVLLLIAGGAGVAPILGHLESLSRRNFRGRVLAVIATRQEADQTFIARLEPLSRRLDLQVMKIVEHPSDDWDGHRGRVDREKLLALLEGTEELSRQVLLCGPTAMMADVTRQLLGLGVPMRAIRYERFDYTEASDPKSRRTRAAFRWLLAAVATTLIVAGWAAS